MLHLLQYYSWWLLLAAFSWPLFRRLHRDWIWCWGLARCLAPAPVALVALHISRWSGQPLRLGAAGAVLGFALVYLGARFWACSPRRQIASQASNSCHPFISHSQQSWYRSSQFWIFESTLLLTYIAFALLLGQHYGSQALGERRLDLGLLTWLMETPSYPPNHFWAAGEKLSYYYFGFVQVGAVASVAHLPAEHAYLAGQCATWTSVLLAGWLIARYYWVRGCWALLPPLLLVFGGSFAPVWQWLSSHVSWWRPNAWPTFVRVIPGTINETPAAALWTTELHAHVLALPALVLTPILVVLAAWRGGWRRLACAAIASASLFMGDAWLAPPAALATTLLLLASVSARSTRRLRAAVVRLALTASAALGLSAPLLVGFEGHPIVWEWVQLSSTRASHLLALFGPAVLVLGIPVVVAVLFSQRPRWLRYHFPQVIALTFSAVLLVVVCECIYLDTGFPPPGERQNTVMRFHWAAFVFLGMALAPAMGCAAAVPCRTRRRVLTAVAVAIVALAVINHTSPIANLLRLNRPWTSDMRLALDSKRDGYLRIAEFLRETPSDTVIAESAGDPYRGYATISAISGRRALAGELDKLVSCGVSIEQVQSRMQHLFTIYAGAPSAADAIASYGVDYIVLGPAERRAFPDLNEQRLLATYPVALRSGHVLLLKVEPKSVQQNFNPAR